MINLKNLGLAGIMALLGTVANAQTASMFTQSTNSTEAVAATETDESVAAVSTAPTVAAELFGSGTGVKLEFGAEGFQPIYKLTYVQARDGEDTPGPVPEESIQSGDEGMITFMLGGAVFAERVSPNDFALNDADAGGTADIEVESGGAKGDLSVTIKVTTGGSLGRH